MKLERHPLSSAFPDMPADELSLLVADIKKHGQHSAGLLFEGKVLDGWHRYLACTQAGINFRCSDYKGSDPVSIVRSHNEMRRHLTASQRAAAEVKLSAWQVSGKHRSAPGADHAAKPSSAPGADHPPKAPDKAPAAESIAVTRTTAEMAQAAGVSVRTIEDAKTAERAGLGDAVRDGMISAKDAAAVAKGKESEPTPKPQPVTKEAKRIADLETENQRLKEELEGLSDGWEAAKAMAEAAGVLMDGDPAKEIIRLKGALRTTEVTRDDYMNQCGELRKQVRILERKLGKMAA